MDAIERVNCRLMGKPVDRVPNLNIIMQFAARYIDINYGKYCTDYRYLAEGNIKCCRDFGIDMVSAISDPFREAEGMGANVVINHDDVPSCRDFLIKDYGDVKKLKTVDPAQAQRMLDRIKAVELYKSQVGQEYPILGWVEGPFAEACDLRGLSDLMIDTMDEPEFVNELMEICLEQAVLFANAQIRAGAGFIGIGDAAASLVGPEIYKRVIMPFETRLIRAIHSAGAKAKLHICGNITPLVQYLPETGADMADIDWMVDLKQVNKVFDGRISACGNFDPVTVILQGTPDIIKSAVKKCLEASDQHTFIAAGCEIPKFTPYENMKAVQEALEEYSR
jgi:MtaA/CmuA family methyltransferase